MKGSPYLLCRENRCYTLNDQNTNFEKNKGQDEDT